MGFYILVDNPLLMTFYQSEIENLSTSIIKYEKTLKTKKVLLKLVK